MASEEREELGKKNQYATMIRDLPQGERPRERLRDYGPSSRNNSELIAILLRVGSEWRIDGQPWPIFCPPPPVAVPGRPAGPERTAVPEISE